MYHVHMSVNASLNKCYSYNCYKYHNPTDAQVLCLKSQARSALSTVNQHCVQTVQLCISTGTLPPQAVFFSFRRAAPRFSRVPGKGVDPFFQSKVPKRPHFVHSIKRGARETMFAQGPKNAGAGPDLMVQQIVQRDFGKLCRQSLKCLNKSA